MAHTQIPLLAVMGLAMACTLGLSAALVQVQAVHCCTCCQCLWRAHHCCMHVGIVRVIS